MARWIRHSADYPELGEITAADVVADVGCGLGDVCVAAAERGAEVIAIDADPALIEHTARRVQAVAARGFRGIVCAADRGIPLPDSSASVVVCTEVLEHIPEPDRLLAELARIGRPGVRYVISVPDPASEALMRFLAVPSYFQPPGHVHVFDHARLDRLIREAGLTVERRPTYPNSFYWAIYALLRAAADEEQCHPVGRFATPDAPKPHPDVVHDWHRVWRTIELLPQGDHVLAALDALLPRTQVVIARKPGRVWRRDAGAPAGWRSALKRRVKDGELRLGHYRIHWRVRRAAAGRETSAGSAP